MKKYCRSIVTAILLLVLLWLFTSCRSSKKENTAEQYNENARQQNDTETFQNKELLAVIEKIIHKALSEQTNISQKETEYDTDKPVNTETGKPPVKKEKETLFEKKRNEIIEETEQTKLTEQDSTYTVDKSKSDYEKNHSVTTQSETNLQKESDIFFKWVGIFVICSVVLFLLFYIHRKFSKI